MDGRYELMVAAGRYEPKALSGKYKLTAAAGRYEPRAATGIYERKAEAKMYRPRERGMQWARLLGAAAEIYKMKATDKRKAWAAVRRYEPRALNNAARLASLVAGNKQTSKTVAGKGTVFSRTLPGPFPGLAEWREGPGAGAGAGAGDGAGGPHPDSLNIVRQAVMQALGGAYTGGAGAGGAYTGGAYTGGAYTGGAYTGGAYTY